MSRRFWVENYFPIRLPSGKQPPQKICEDLKSKSSRLKRAGKFSPRGKNQLTSRAGDKIKFFEREAGHHVVRGKPSGLKTNPVEIF